MQKDRKSSLIPMGLLFVGVPGNGKSHLTRAFAHDCGMNMLRFKNLRSMWVGESERNLETVLDLLPSLAPCIVFIDEIDQMFSSRTGSQGNRHEVDARLMGRLWDFMGDSSHRGDILWIGATNRPDLLDIATIRRFDRIFPFMNPTDEARIELIKDLFGKLNIPYDKEYDYSKQRDLMKDFSCDDVEKVIRRAYEICIGRNEQAVTNDHVESARRVYKHNYDPVMHELVALLSVQKSNFLSDLPWFDENGIIGDVNQIPVFLKNCVNQDGYGFNESEIEKRIEELKSMSRF